MDAAAIFTLGSKSDAGMAHCAGITASTPSSNNLPHAARGPAQGKVGDDYIYTHMPADSALINSSKPRLISIIRRCSIIAFKQMLIGFNGPQAAFFHLLNAHFQRYLQKFSRGIKALCRCSCNLNCFLLNERVISKTISPNIRAES